VGSQATARGAVARALERIGQSKDYEEALGVLDPRQWGEGKGKAAGKAARKASSTAAVKDGGCIVCGGLNDEDKILLCDGDGCGGQYHLACLRPALTRIPEEDWFCPRCSARSGVGRGVGSGVGKAEDKAVGKASGKASGKAVGKVGGKAVGKAGGKAVGKAGGKAIEGRLVGSTGDWTQYATGADASRELNLDPSSVSKCARGVTGLVGCVGSRKGGGKETKHTFPQYEFRYVKQGDDGEDGGKDGAARRSSRKATPKKEWNGDEDGDGGDDEDGGVGGGLVGSQNNGRKRRRPEDSTDHTDSTSASSSSSSSSSCGCPCGKCIPADGGAGREAVLTRLLDSGKTLLSDEESAQFAELPEGWTVYVD
jgi:hypothetical protein